MIRLLKSRDHVALLALLLLGVVAYFSLENTSGHRGGVAELDGYYYYVYLRSIQMDGDIDLGNEYRRWGNPFKYGKTPTGYHRNVFGVGPAILWAPFFLLTHLIAIIGVKLGFPLSLDGMSRFHQAGTFLGTLVYGWGAVVFCYLIARRLFGRGSALWAVLGAALAGPLPCYCLTYASYSHAQAAFCASLMVYLWIRWREAWSLRRWILFGGAAGLLLLVRPACLPLLTLPLLEGCRVLWERTRLRDWRAAAGPLAGAVAAVLVFSPQMAVWRIMYGELMLTPQGQDFMRWDQIAWHATLFSPRNGLFPSAPLMAAAVLGLVLLTRKKTWLGLSLGMTFIALALLNGAVSDWWGWGFSARRYTAALPIFAVGLCAALEWARRRMSRNPARAVGWITGCVVLLAILFNLQWMRVFNQKNLTWYSVRSTQGLYMLVTHSLLDRVYSAAGNPMSLPSSLAFGIRHGGSPRTYDRIEGYYMLGESTRGANPSAKPYKNATLKLGSLEFRHQLSQSFGNPRRSGKVSYAPLRAPRAHVFMPINRPGKLRIMIVAQAKHRGTVVSVSFNGHRIGRRPLPTRGWSRAVLTVPARFVRRGINRLDLSHHMPRGWDDPGPRCFGRPRTCIPVDLAAVSGGPSWGNFAEIWLDNTKVSQNIRGVNLAVVSPTTGALLGQRGFDTFAYPALFSEIARYLGTFPAGSVVAVAVRGQPDRNFNKGGRAALAAFGAVTDLSSSEEAGYAAIGITGAAPGAAMEKVAEKGHARVRVGNRPGPWRELARYRAIVLR